MQLAELLKKTTAQDLKKEYETELLSRLRRSRVFVLPCYALSLLYFLYADVYINHFLPAAYARAPVLAMVAGFAVVCLMPRLYYRWGFMLHHISLFGVMAMMTYILAVSVDQPFYSSAITALIMVIVIVLVEERGGLRVTLPIYGLPALALAGYFFHLGLPPAKATALGNPLVFVITCLIYSKVQENFRWRDFINMKTIEVQKQEAEVLYQEVLAKSREIAEQKDEMSAQNAALNQQMEDAKQKNHFIQHQHNTIMTSLAYAKLLQSATLPYAQRFNEVFGPGRYFILFKPRDLVSGDFYWLYSDASQVLLAVVDCTGHGVPGAFMSLIGSQLLTETVELRQIFSPEKILDELHKQTRRILQQDQSGSRDGMEIQLIRWQKGSQVVEFAGAMNPCYYLPAGATELVELKGDKKPIGGEQDEAERHFTLHQIPLLGPTLFYLCTDGYQDQFGGPRKRKFMTGQLRELLAGMAGQPLAAQQQLLDSTLESWRRETNQPQVDDITVLGVRLG
jgi:serine phosphatase RsbU (regulator of sigma subunit)